jgi:DNA-binding response OmpR family regulator
MRVPKQLLIVEDDRHSREGYKRYLSGAGFIVQALDGGADAFHLAKASPPDLVVLDLGLPEVDGWEVARQFKSDEQTKSIPIIAFSGHSMQHEQVSALRAGCDIYLTKPCAPDRLLSTIRKLLGMADPSPEDRNRETDRDPY